MTPHESILSSIAAIDTALSMARELWLEARDDESRRKYRAKIDGLLDQRLPLMKERDKESV